MTAFDSQTRNADDPEGAGVPDFDRECERIEATLAETERGRRFLAAHAHRHRGADTQTLLRAITRLETVVTQEMRHGTDGEGDRAALAVMAEAIACTRAELRRDTDATGTPEPFEAMLAAAEATTSEILGDCEALQEAAWKLREKGVDEPLCDVLDRRAASIGTACAAQDRIMQAGLAIARTLSLIESRIAAQTASSATVGPRPASPAVAPSPIPAADELASIAAADDQPTQAPSQGAAVPPPESTFLFDGERALDGSDRKEPARNDLATAFADLDRLSIEEKIALFS